MSFVFCALSESGVVSGVIGLLSPRANNPKVESEGKVYSKMDTAKSECKVLLREDVTKRSS